MRKLVSTALIFTSLAIAGEWRPRRSGPTWRYPRYTRSRHVAASEAAAIALAAGIGGYVIAERRQRSGAVMPQPQSVPVVLDPNCHVVELDGEYRVMCKDGSGGWIVR